jgi:NAD(P)-dependent dehydrogenase (short-subunit alcohol dehydrogenase family)
MRVEDSVAFVTGANRGLGLAFAKELLGRGVKKLYAGIATRMASTCRG